MRRPSRVAWSAAAAVALVASITPIRPAAAATTRTWVGPNGGTWSTAVNWSPSGAPQNGDSIVLASDSFTAFDLPGLVLAQVSVTPDAGPGFTYVSPDGNPGPLTLTGGVSGGDLRLLVPVSLTTGVAHHLTAVGSAGSVELESVLGGGTLVSDGPGTARVGPTAQFSGTIDARGGRLETEGLGAPNGHLTMAGGAAVSVRAHASESELTAGITVLDGATPARLDLEMSTLRLSGAVHLEGDLVAGGFGTYTGPITGPGALRVESISPNFPITLEGSNSYSGGTAVGGGERTVAMGLSPLGAGNVAIDSGSALLLVDVPNFVGDVAYDSAEPPFGDAHTFLQVSGVTTITGQIEVTGSNLTYLSVVALGPSPSPDPRLTLAGGLVSSAPVGIMGSEGASIQITGPSSVPHLGVERVEVDIAASAGPGVVVGAAWVWGGPNAAGTLSLRADGQHDPATPFEVRGGTLDFWGHDQGASGLHVDGYGTLYLGTFDDDGTPLTATLDSGPIDVEAGASMSFVLSPSGSDRIRTPSGRFDGTIDLYSSRVLPVGQPITIVEVTGAGPLQRSGAADLPQEGDELYAGQQAFRLSFVGGTGNDITVTPLPGLFSSWTFEDFVEQGGGMRGAPSLSSWGPGRIDGWIVGLDRAVWHRYSDDEGNGGWESLGGISLATPAAVSQRPGEVDLFIRGADGALWTRAYRNGWGGWLSLGGIITDAPAVTSPSPGSIVVVARGADGALWMRRMVADAWQPWSPLGGGTPSAPAVTDWGNGRIDVFIRGLDGALWQRTSQGDVWGPWHSHGGIVTEAPAVSSTEPGQLAVFIRGADGLLWHRSWEGAGWSAWWNTGVPIATAPATAGQGPGALVLGIRSPTGSLWTSVAWPYY